MGVVHFWTRSRDALIPWVPDAEPDLHPTAYGHAFLELYSRMHALEYSVSIGPVIPTDCEVVVTSLHELYHWEFGLENRLTFELAVRTMLRIPLLKIVVIRVDLPLQVLRPGFASLEVVPTRASAERPDQVWVPMLPNRGLVPRDEARVEKLETVALKAYSFNVPAWLDDGFLADIRTLGFDLRVDTELNGRWRDFAAVDVVLCAHDEKTLQDARRKPATKLVNAWRAGAIPVCGPYNAYNEVGRDGETMLVCDGTAEGFVNALAVLRNRPEVAARIRSNLPEQARLYAPDQIVFLWWEAFMAAPPSSRRELVVGTAGVAWRLVMRKVRIGARHHR